MGRAEDLGIPHDERSKPHPETVADWHDSRTVLALDRELERHLLDGPVRGFLYGSLVAVPLWVTLIALIMRG